MSLFICIVLCAYLSGCSQSGNTSKSTTQLITEAAQTVEAMLTQTQPAATETPEPTATPSATPELSPTVTETGVPTGTTTPSTYSSASYVNYSACDMAAFVSDVTISDGTDMNGGEAFTKTWSLRNAGTCTWTDEYMLVFHSGDQMDGPDEQQLVDDDETVSPGETISVSVDLVAPNDEGTYTGYWMLENASGSDFGTGSGNNAFYVLIDVTSTSTETPTPTTTATSVSATSTPTATTVVAATATQQPTSTTAPTATPVPTHTPVPTAAPTETAASGG